MKDIKNVKLKFSCDANWDSMDAAGGAKYCEQCQKKVYDFTDAKQYEFLAILAENNNNVCGRFRPEQMAPVRFALPAWQKLISAAFVLIGINVFNNKTFAQSTKQSTVKQNTSIRELVVGMVGNPSSFNSSTYPLCDNYATFPGGNEALSRFLSKNIHYKNRMVNGKVFIKFDVNKNGALSNFVIERGLSKANNEEVMRAFKLSPKWNPATLKGKPVLSSYTIPVHFEK
jgi:hypothetical protein